MGARRQEARSLELRAPPAISPGYGASRAGASKPAIFYGWFTEGFDTADLKEAKALLAQLA
jgi:hypothetical protein